MTINQRDLLGRVKENEIDRVIDFTCRLLGEQKGPAVKVRVRDILDHAVSTDELKTMNRNLCLAYDLSKKRCEDFINNKDKNQHVPHPLWFYSNCPEFETLFEEPTNQVDNKEFLENLTLYWKSYFYNNEEDDDEGDLFPFLNVQNNAEKQAE